MTIRTLKRYAEALEKRVVIEITEAEPARRGQLVAPELRLRSFADRVVCIQAEQQRPAVGSVEHVIDSPPGIEGTRRDTPRASRP